MRPEVNAKSEVFNLCCNRKNREGACVRTQAGNSNFSGKFWDESLQPPGGEK